MEEAPEEAGGEAEGAEMGGEEGAQGAAAQEELTGMTWVETLIWGFCRWLGNAMQLVGLIGLLGFGMIGLRSIGEAIFGKDYRNDD